MFSKTVHTIYRCFGWLPVSRSVRDIDETLYQLIDSGIQLKFYESYVPLQGNSIRLQVSLKKTRHRNWQKKITIIFFSSNLSSKLENVSVHPLAHRPILIINTYNSIKNKWTYWDSNPLTFGFRHQLWVNGLGKKTFPIS
jgi:hypothetical protein